MNESGYSGTQAAKVVGITYRQLDYWARTDLIRPSLTDAAGSGSRRRYSYNDLLELRVIKTLLDAGIKLESVRDVFEYLRKHVGGDIGTVRPKLSRQRHVGPISVSANPSQFRGPWSGTSRCRLDTTRHH